MQNLAGGGDRAVLLFGSTVTADSYLNLIKEDFLPELVQYHMPKEVRVLQQDCARAHFAAKVRHWLDTYFPDGWMGTGSASMPCPACCPDLTTWDFFVWGYVNP